MARLSYSTTEERLRKEFETFGKIDIVRVVKNLEGKSKGYAFITFRHEKDAAYARDKADGRRVDNHRILVDRELGRTKKSWLPRRLGGGKGGETRQGPADYLVDEVRREIRREQQEAEEKKDRKRREEEAENKPVVFTELFKQKSSAMEVDEREPGELWPELINWW